MSKELETRGQFQRKIEMAYDLSFTGPLPRYKYSDQSSSNNWRGSGVREREKDTLPEDYLASTGTEVLEKGLHALQGLAKEIVGVISNGGIVYATGERFPPHTAFRIGINKRVLIAQDQDGFLMRELLRTFGHKDSAQAPILRVGEDSLEAAGLTVDDSKFAHGYVFPPKSVRFLRNDEPNHEERDYYSGFAFYMVAGEYRNTSLIRSDYLPSWILRQAILTGLMEGTMGENSWPVRRLKIGKDGKPAVIEEFDYLEAANHLTTSILSDAYNAVKLPFWERARIAMVSDIGELRTINYLMKYLG